jgi:hypothetical protein
VALLVWTEAVATSVHSKKDKNLPIESQKLENGECKCGRVLVWKIRVEKSPLRARLFSRWSHIDSDQSVIDVGTYEIHALTCEARGQRATWINEAAITLHPDMVKTMKINSYFISYPWKYT